MPIDVDVRGRQKSLRTATIVLRGLIGFDQITGLDVSLLIGHCEVAVTYVRQNLLILMLGLIFQMVLIFLQKLNFIFSMVAEPLVEYLRGNRVFTIALARRVAGRRHRMHRGRGWRYAACVIS